MKKTLEYEHWFTELPELREAVLKVLKELPLPLEKLSEESPSPNRWSGRGRHGAVSLEVELTLLSRDLPPPSTTIPKVKAHISLEGPAEEVDRMLALFKRRYELGVLRGGG